MDSFDYTQDMTARELLDAFEALVPLEQKDAGLDAIAHYIAASVALELDPFAVLRREYYGVAWELVDGPNMPTLNGQVAVFPVAHDGRKCHGAVVAARLCGHVRVAATPRMPSRAHRGW